MFSGQMFGPSAFPQPCLPTIPCMPALTFGSLLAWQLSRLWNLGVGSCGGHDWGSGRIQGLGGWGFCLTGFLGQWSLRSLLRWYGRGGIKRWSQCLISQ